VLLVLVTVAAQSVLSAAGPASETLIRGVEQQLLEPERAFRLSARHIDTQTLELSYKIADGYYMYRGRFKFVLEPKSSGKTGKARFSRGEMKQDPTFGRVEVYRDSVRILLPVSMAGGPNNSINASPARLRVTSQGCADVGVCYPPQHQTLTINAGVGGVFFPDIAANSGSATAHKQFAPGDVPPSLADALRNKR
jgi:thiol:disulfide interchange protein DsbD